jgi:hypothetical protein
VCHCAVSSVLGSPLLSEFGWMSFGGEKKGNRGSAVVLIMLRRQDNTDHQYSFYHTN